MKTWYVIFKTGIGITGIEVEAEDVSQAIEIALNEKLFPIGSIRSVILI
jgi:hypothetical protein